jgi:hypothetical protein
MANITYPDKIVGSQYLNTEANQVKEVVNTNAARLTTVEGVAPTSNQKAALAGTHGSPSGSNRYVTDGDPRLGALSNPKAIFFPVDDLAELKAIDTTEAEQAPDKWLILVKDLGVYYLDRTSTETPDDSLVVEPTAGPGRWIRETRLGDGGGGPAIAAIYDDIADMIADQGDQEAQAFYRVNDSTAAGLTGYSTWEYLGTTGGVIADYRLESAEEYLQPSTGGGSSTITVRNQTGSTIAKGAPVYISGAGSGFPLISLARANAESTCTNVYITDEEITNNNNGKALKIGEVTPVDTTGFTAGDLLYLSSATAGVITTTPPASPNFVVFLGIAADSDASGKIVVSVRNSLANSNTLGTSQLLPPSQNAVKQYVDNNVTPIDVNFTALSTANVTINPTRKIGNNYVLTRSADGKITADFTGVPEGASGLIEVVNSGAVQKLGFNTRSNWTVGQDILTELPAIGASGKTITGAANNGSGLIRITSTAHGFSTNDRIEITGVVGTVEANGKWTITVITSDTFDLVGSAFVNAYTSGGTATLLEDFIFLNEETNGTSVFIFYKRGGKLVLNGNAFMI